MSTRLFAVERYDATGGHVAPHEPFPRLPDHLRVAAVIHLPADEVVIAFVEGCDEAAVSVAVEAAGWRVDRINPAEWLLGTGDPR
ncbi:MAG: hypothetical protein ACTHMS_14255 [Jatrophihabitans sp.]|uniref:hypothetical protein n=1 Tax=Jatrophihabitans sp. TaxID=1932789 RepID=UPI003F815521